MFRAFRWHKAIPAVMAGMAFFLAACRSGTPVPERPSKPQAADQFAVGEAYREQGELEKALRAYGLYLRQNRGGKRYAQALHCMGEIYSKLKRYDEALDIFKEILEDYPQYAGVSLVRYEIAGQLHYLGNYLLSLDAATNWLVQYPEHPLRGEVMMLIGDNHRALGDNVEAFRWWLKAEKESLHSVERRTKGKGKLGELSDGLRRQALLNEKLEDLIERSGIEDLEQLARHAAGSSYAPKVYYRMATVFMKQNEPEKAKQAAMTLVESTPEQYWVSAGRRLLEKIGTSISPKKRVVGCLLPLSGPFAVYGRKILNGIRLGSERPGPGEEMAPLELVVRDTEGRIDHALGGLEELVKKRRVMAVIGPLSSRAAPAVANRAQALGVPLITLTQKEKITEAGEMVFRNFLTPSREVTRLLDEAIDNKGIKRFAVLYPDSPYGRFFMDLFQTTAEERGTRVSPVVSYNPDQTDFTRQTKELAGQHQKRPRTSEQGLREKEPIKGRRGEGDQEGSGPVIAFEALFIPDTFQKAAMIAPQLLFDDISGVLLMGTSLWQSPQLIELAGDYVQGAIFPSGFFEMSDALGVAAFVEQYQAAYDATPGILAATGYDTIRLLGKVLAGKGILTRKDVQEALLECRAFQGVTGDISFDSHGEVEKRPFLLTVSGDEIVLYR